MQFKVHTIAVAMIAAPLAAQTTPVPVHLEVVKAAETITRLKWLSPPGLASIPPSW
jgi:hypothetical protein